ncbi:hypothetical protein MHUMG1_00944 [Metarhizium humberi]|uniref:Uncharacterized protein n=1 Tax=Metarhizium humberi TaxID=2596975 RepID=A0A9P8MP86_9HYPO|nr:hypothetical protein MHUMG1_00944 [Metarhizium humberi]
MAKNKPTSLAEYGLSKKSGLGAPASLFWGSAELDQEKLSNLDVCGMLNQQYQLLRTRFRISTPSIRCLYNRFAVTHGGDFVMGPGAMEDGGKTPGPLCCVVSRCPAAVPWSARRTASGARRRTSFPSGKTVRPGLTPHASGYTVARPNITPDMVLVGKDCRPGSPS